MTTLTTGTITATSLYSNPTFDSPGNRAITTALEYPYYNEAMGVFSLIKKPVVEYHTTGTSDGTYFGRTTDYHVVENLQYVINPASGLEVQDFQVALMQAGSKDPGASGYGVPAGWYYEGMAPQADGTNKHMLRTDYVDSGCLTNQQFTLEVADIKNQFPYLPASQPAYLKFILNLRPIAGSANTQNVLVVLKYPVTMVSVAALNVDYSAPCLAVQPQQTAAQVQAVCTGSAYQGAVALRTTGPATAGSPAAPAIAEVQVYPNPATNAATISFSGTASGRASAYLTDMFGNRVLTIMKNEAVAAGPQRKEFATSSLPSGLYQCVIETPDGRRVSTRLSVVR